MAKSLFSQLSTATHRVLAAALIHERRFGKPMSPSVIRELCTEERASFTACLAIIRGQGQESRTGKVVPIDAPGDPIDANDDETVAALDWRERIDKSRPT